jgi:hypothetical protein
MGVEMTTLVALCGLVGVIVAAGWRRSRRRADDAQRLSWTLHEVQRRGSRSGFDT